MAPTHAIVAELYVTDAKNRPMVAVDAAEAVARRGLVGDRYYLGDGFYSNRKGWGADVTLVETEAIEAVNIGHQTDFTAAQLRRNILTTNVKLETLIGCDFRCGSAILRGTKPFPPCVHLAHLTGRREVLKYFAYCGGIGASVVEGGDIRLKDRIEIITS